MNSNNEYSYYVPSGKERDILDQYAANVDTSPYSAPLDSSGLPNGFLGQVLDNPDQDMYIKQEDDTTLNPAARDSKPNVMPMKEDMFQESGMGGLGAVFPFEPISPQWPANIPWDVSGQSPHTRQLPQDLQAAQAGQANQANQHISSGKPQWRLPAQPQSIHDQRDSHGPRHDSRHNSHPGSSGSESRHASASDPDRVPGRSAHNIIEQRYRNKINDRFEELLACVPALRAAYRRRSTIDGAEDDDEGVGGSDEDLEGLSPARKLNKGTILEKLVEYIEFLKQKNARIMKEREKLLEQARMMGLQVDDDER